MKCFKKSNTIALVAALLLPVSNCGAWGWDTIGNLFGCPASKPVSRIGRIAQSSARYIKTNATKLYPVVSNVGSSLATPFKYAYNFVKENPTTTILGTGVVACIGLIAKMSYDQKKDRKARTQSFENQFKAQNILFSTIINNKEKEYAKRLKITKAASEKHLAKQKEESNKALNKLEEKFVKAIQEQQNTINSNTKISQEERTKLTNELQKQINEQTKTVEEFTNKKSKILNRINKLEQDAKNISSNTKIEELEKKVAFLKQQILLLPGMSAQISLGLLAQAANSNEKEGDSDNTKNKADNVNAKKIKKLTDTLNKLENKMKHYTTKEETAEIAREEICSAFDFQKETRKKETISLLNKVF